MTPLRFSTLLLLGLALAAGGCSLAERPGPSISRPEGEGFAGRGELVLRIGMPAGGGISIPGVSSQKPERASVELRYLGLDATGRAMFERHDIDTLAGAPVPPSTESGAGEANAQTAGPTAPDTRQIVLDLRLTRQIRIQGKIIEILEATPSGVVFRIY